MSVPAPLTDVAADWIRCDSCHEYVYRRRFVRALHVCPGCGHHGRLSARERIALLLDDVGHEELPAAVVAQDPLEFADTRPYRERMAEARARTGLDEAIVVVHGHLDGHRVVVAAMDFEFIGGSLGVGVGEQLARAADWARETASPLVIVCASGGARMQEGALSLMQMATTAQALGRLDDAGILTVSLVTDPTYGGVAASFATLCDVVIAEPRARMGFAGPRVIEQTINQTLPEGFQTAEFLREHGLIDDVVERSSLRGFLSDLLALNRSGVLGLADGAPDDTQSDEVPAPSAWEAVQRARHIDRPTALDYAHRMLVGFHELHGDRASADCPAIVGGFGRLGGRPVLLVGHQKGHSTRELVARSFGMPSPAGFRKAGRLMRLAQKLAVPVVTLIDTPGAHPGLAAEENGQAVAIAESIRTMAGLTVPVVSVVTGEGGSGGALALGVANRVLSLANGVYSVISPEGCASILWKDSSAAPVAAEALQIDATALMRLSVIDRVVPEPAGGAHLDPDGAARAVAAALMTALAELGGLGPDELLDQRRDRFRRISGAPEGGSR